MDMKQLGKEYRKSLRQLNKRIHTLRSELKKLESDKKSDKAHIQELKHRLKPLLAMQRDLRELSQEVSKYYIPGWWRSEKYTFNRRKARRYIPYFRNVFEEDILHELEPDPEDEESNVPGHRE